MSEFSKIKNGAGQNGDMRLKNSSGFLFTPEVWKSYIKTYHVTYIIKPLHTATDQDQFEIQTISAINCHTRPLSDRLYVY